MKIKTPYAKPEFQVHIIQLEYNLANGSIPINNDNIEITVEEWKLENSFEKELEF